MSFVPSAVSRHAPKRIAFRTFAIALTTALIVLFLPGTAFAVGEPSAPAQPTVTHGDGAISVAFVAPADNGSPITFYPANCVSADGGAAGTTSDAASPILVLPLTNGKTYTCTVNATNANGAGSSSVASASTVPAGVPDAPFKPTVTRGNAQISVVFVAPGDNGSAITGYTASCTSSNGGTLGSISGSTSPLVVAGLTNGSLYTCKVLATNGEGNSAQSLASSAVVPATVPSAPVQPTVVHGNANISVTFTGSASSGGATVTGYTATCTSSDGGASGSNTGASSPIVVSTLTNGKTYTCTVHGTNAVGNSLESPASASTVPATVPSVPAQPTVTRGGGQISVAFVAPANGGSTITGYTAACTSSDGGASGNNTGGTSPIAVTGLTNAKTYTCTVFATNVEGNSAASAASASAVPGLVPSASAQPTVTHGNASISVAFTAPSSDGGSSITGYTATCTSSDGGTTGSNSGATSPLVASGLTNGKTYTCTVFASNINGAGNASVASASTVPATTPGTPAPPTLTHGNASISVAFTAPVSDGGSTITAYTATCTSSDGGAAASNAGATSPVIVSTLTNGKTYTCVVRATNAEGNGSNSVASASTIPATVPSTPAQPTIAPSGTTMNVTFVAPANGGSAITGYTASCTSSNGGTAGSNTGATSPIGVTSLSLGKSYTCTVHATNAEGDSTDSVASAGATIPAIVPGVPAQATVTPGNASMSVAFTAPTSDGGSAITGYTATCTSSDGGATGSNTGASSPITVSTLTNGKTYTCTVHATNTIGSGGESPASTSAVPSMVPATPAQPTTVAAATHITVTFVAPANGGSAITGYTATCTSSNGGTTGSNSGSTSPISVQSLTKSKSYTCTVHATNAVGDSAESPVSSATVIPATVPDAPAQPVTTFGNGQISVAFVAPNNGGSAITGYSANCASSDGGAPGSLSGATSPIVVSGLANAKTYTCTVLATNSLGDGDASVASAATVPATTPGTPGAPTLTRGNASLSVAFVAPVSNGGSAITGYTASCTSSDGGGSGSSSGANSPIVVSTLTNGKTYTCTVLATNVAGNGTASPASGSAVPATVPSAPAGPTPTRGNAQISVAFVAPADGGSAITGYTASCTSSDDGASGSNTGATSPIVVATLTNGKTYSCTVVATNAVGDGLASPASVTAVPATVPTAPVAPTLTHGNASIAVAIAAPNTGGSAITGYTATCTSSDSGTAGNHTSVSSPSVVTALTNGKTYTCTAHVTNAVGNSTESPASLSTIPATTPSASAVPTLTRGNRQLSVAIVTPATGGSAITGYTASCTSSDGGEFGAQSNATSPVVVMTPLTNGKNYTCTVHANNAEGAGTESAASASMMPGVAPQNTGAPAITGSSINHHTLTAHDGSWRAGPPATLTRRWQRCNSVGTACVNIAGAVGHTYQTRNADLNHRLRFVVTATNALGSLSMSSPASGRIHN